MLNITIYINGCVCVSVRVCDEEGYLCVCVSYTRVFLLPLFKCVCEFGLRESIYRGVNFFVTFFL